MTLKSLIDSNKSIIFVLDDKPKDLIEDISARIVIQMKMKIEEENMDEDSD